MRNATSGTSLPICTYSWLIAAQGIAANGNLSPAAIPCPGARVGDLVLVSAKTRIPQTAGGAAATLEAWVSTDNNIGLVISNASTAGPLIVTAADVEIAMMCFPRSP